MDLIFAGTPVFAQRALDALLAAGHRVSLVLTQPDRPAGRGQRLLASPVKQRALAAGIEVFQPRTLRDPLAQQTLRAHCDRSGARVMVVAAYGLLLPPEVLSMPALGCVNIHASLLPRWRGAAPIQRAIEAGDERTGITIMQMDAGLDTGPMLLTRELAIAPHENAASLHDRLAALGAEAIVEALDGLAAGTLVPVAQPSEGVTYARKIERADAAIDWSRSAREIVDRVRAFDPVPGATLRLERADAEPLKLWRAARTDECSDAPPGSVVAADARGLQAVAGDGQVLAMLELQRPGGRRLAAGDFLRGHPIRVGERFAAP